MPRGSPRDVLVRVTGWAGGEDEGTGGLYLAGDPFDCPPERLLAASNVDITPDGSVQVRRGCRPFTQVTPSGKYQIMAATFDTPTQAWGTSKLVSVVLDYRSGSASQDFIENSDWHDPDIYNYPFSHTRGDIPSIAPWLGRTYIAWPANSAPQAVVRRMTESPGTVVLTDPAANGGAGWSDDFLTPKEGFFPPSNYIYQLDQGGLTYMLAANGGTLRWSHPSNEDQSKGSEAWREEDYTLIGTDRLGGIRAIAQYRDLLLVFKNNSIWALTGSFPSQVITSLIADNLGVVDHRAVAVSRHGVWFYAVSRGLYLWDGSKVVPVAVNNLGSMENWRPAVGLTQSTPVGEAVSYWNEKVYVSGFSPPGVVHDPDDVSGRQRGSFVYDLRSNTWTFHRYTMMGVIEDPNRPTGLATTDRFYAYGSFLENEGGNIFRLPEMGNRTEWTDPGADDVYGADSLESSRDYEVIIHTGYAQAENPAEMVRWRHADLDGYMTHDIEQSFDTFEYEVRDKGKLRIVTGGPSKRPGFVERVALVLKWKRPVSFSDVITGITFRYWRGWQRPS